MNSLYKDYADIDISMDLKNIDLILDPLTHAPHLKYLIENALYYTLDNTTGDYMKGHYDINTFISRFKFDYRKDIGLMDQDPDQKFNNLFIVIPLLSTVEKHQGPNYVKWMDFYTNLYNTYKPKITGKIILLDDHDYCYEPDRYADRLGIKYDIILKRTYNKNSENKNEKTRVSSYPFIMCTNNDPMYELFNQDHGPNNTSYRTDRIVWAGSLYLHDERFDDIVEYSDRLGTYNRFNQKYPDIVETIKVSYDEYMNKISEFKYILDLRGAGRLNKRLYEILQTNSLLIGEKIDIYWPFEDGDKFSDECFFEQGDIDDFYNKYKALENSPDLYIKCLNNQKYIAQKYFNNKWIGEYISKIVNLKCKM